MKTSVKHVTIKQLCDQYDGINVLEYTTVFAPELGEPTRTFGEGILRMSMSDRAKRNNSEPIVDYRYENHADGRGRIELKASKVDVEDRIYWRGNDVDRRISKAKVVAGVLLSVYWLDDEGRMSDVEHLLVV